MKISIVVASKNGPVIIHDCLRAWRSQLGDQDEMIIVADSSTFMIEVVRDEFPSATLLNRPKSFLVPELWTEGIQQSTGDLIGITIDGCIPKSDWADNARKLFESNCSAIGGAIQVHHDASIIDLAVYLCRYWRYLPSLTTVETADLPGDNCIYRRSDLIKYQPFFQSGFWEPEINSRMKRDGLKLVLSSELLVSHKKSFGFFSFLKNRIQHGFHFGRDRSAQLNPLKRLAFVFAFPVIPLLHLRRIWNALKNNRVYTQKLFFALPVLILFLATWALGEILGYIAGPLHHENRD